MLQPFLWRQERSFVSLLFSFLSTTATLYPFMELHTIRPVQSEIDSIPPSWATSPSSPMSPMTPSPMINSSPEPSFVSGFGGSLGDVLDKSFSDLSSHFSAFDSQSCMQPTMSIYDSNSNNNLIIAESESLYSAFGDPYHPLTNVPWTDLDLEFSAFVNSIPQYDMWSQARTPYCLLFVFQFGFMLLNKFIRPTGEETEFCRLPRKIYHQTYKKCV